MNDERKSLLILRASDDVCGDEINLIKRQSALIDIDVKMSTISSEKSLSSSLKKLYKSNLQFDYIYLCTHADKSGFQIDKKGAQTEMTWLRFSNLLCEYDILKNSTIFLLACCKGGLTSVAMDIMSVCDKINHICGVKWTAHAWDLTTGFIVFLHNIENKNAEPNYAAKKASLATDYSFVCHDRDELEMHPSYLHIQWCNWKKLGWVVEENVASAEPDT